MKTIHASVTVVTTNGQRIKLGLICPSRRDADQIIERLYPEARYTSTIVRRRKGGAAC